MDVATAILSWVQPVWNFMILATILIGFAFAGYGLKKFHQGLTEGNGPKTHEKQGFFTFVVGLFLINIKAVLDDLSMTIFNQTTQTGIAYSGGGGGQYAEIVHAAFSIISLVGLYGIISGLLILRSEKEELWHGLRRLAGGTLAVNIVPALTFLGGSLGGTMQAVITKLIG